jgi:hypothetical protein
VIKENGFGSKYEIILITIIINWYSVVAANGVKTRRWAYASAIKGIVDPSHFSGTALRKRAGFDYEHMRGAPSSALHTMMLIFLLLQITPPRCTANCTSAVSVPSALPPW